MLELTMSMFPPNMSFTLLPSEIRQYILKFVPSTSLNEYACVNQQCCADVKDKILPVRSELLPKAILYRTSVNLIQRMLNYCDSSIIGAPSLPSTASQHHSHHHHNRPENMYKVHRWIDQSLWMAVGLGHDEMIPYLLNSYRQILRKQQHQNSNVIDDDKINKMSPPVCCILNDDSGFYRIKNIATIYELLTYPSVSQMCQLVKDSSLMYAIYFGDLELTRILIEAGANWKKSNDLNTLSVVKSCILYDRLDILTYLIDTFGRDECLSHDPSLVANYIAEASSMDMTKYLMSLYDSDTSPHILQLLNTAAVVVACRLSDVLFARTLLQHGILWDTTWDDMSYSNRVLEEAIAAGVPELIQLVLEAQEDQFILCGYQVRDAHNVESLHILVTYAVDRNQYDDQFHDDVLFAACLIGDIEFVQRVLQMGPTSMQFEEGGTTDMVITTAIQRGQVTLLRALLDGIVNVDRVEIDVDRIPSTLKEDIDAILEEYGVKILDKSRDDDDENIPGLVQALWNEDETQVLRLLQSETHVAQSIGSAYPLLCHVLRASNLSATVLREMFKYGFADALDAQSYTLLVSACMEVDTPIEKIHAVLDMKNAQWVVRPCQCA